MKYQVVGVFFNLKVVATVNHIGYFGLIQVGIGIKSTFIKASKDSCDTMEFFNRYMCNYKIDDNNS